LILDTTAVLGCVGSVNNITYWYSCCENNIIVDVYNPNTFAPSLQYRICFEFPDLSLTLCSKPYTLNAGEQKQVVPDIYIPKIPRGDYWGSAYDQYWDGSNWVTESTTKGNLYINAGCLTKLTISVSVLPC